MSTPKRHHYLPESYLAGFTRDRSAAGVFFVYDRDVAAVRRQTPRNTTVKSHYYTVATKTTDRSTHVEEALAKVESLAIPVVRKIESRLGLTQNEREALALFVALLGCRVPQFERGLRESTSALHKRVSALAFHSVDDVVAELRRQGVDTDDASEKALDLHRLIQDGDYDVSPSKEWLVRMMLESALEEGWLFWQMNWAAVHAPKNSSFIVSDAPLMLLPPENWRSQFPHLGYGLLTPGVQKIIPLTERVALMMLDKGEGLIHLDAPRSDVRSINISLALRCERFLIGRDEALVKSIASNARLKENERRALFRVE